MNGESCTSMKYARKGLSDFIKGKIRSRNQLQNSGFMGIVEFKLVFPVVFSSIPSV